MLSEAKHPTAEKEDSSPAFGGIRMTTQGEND